MEEYQLTNKIVFHQIFLYQWDANKKTFEKLNLKLLKDVMKRDARIK